MDPGLVRIADPAPTPRPRSKSESPAAPAAGAGAAHDRIAATNERALAAISLAAIEPVEAMTEYALLRR